MRVYLWTIVILLALAIVIKIGAMASERKDTGYHFFDLVLFVGLFIWGMVVVITQ